MTFLCFAYGSNMLPARLLGRCPSGKLVGTGVARAWSLAFSKASKDGSGKATLVTAPNSAVPGVIFEIDLAEREQLDRHEALGVFFHLYLILDIWSRKITGWEVHDRENGELAAQVIEKAVWAEGCMTRPLTLHADNGSPMKAATLRVTLERLGVTASFSRPRVSNDNPFSEAIFRTCKYVPSWPEKGFESLEAARAWVAGFVRWRNGEHRHSAIRFATPDQRHRQQDRAILDQRHAIYQAARVRRILAAAD